MINNKKEPSAHALSLATVAVGRCIGACAMRITRVTCVFHTRRYTSVRCTASILYDSTEHPHIHLPVALKTTINCANKNMHHETYNGLLRARTLACRLGVMLRFLNEISKAEKVTCLTAPATNCCLPRQPTGPRAKSLLPSPSAIFKSAQGIVVSSAIQPPHIDPTRIAIACQLLYIARVLF